MRRIGILTFHHVYNYGATLQAYSLLTALKKLAEDSDVRVIDYRNSALEDAVMLVKPGEGVSPRSLAKVAFRLVKHRGFDAFDAKRMRLTKPMESPKSISEEYSDGDVIVVGSDQVWKDDITDSDPVFYLDIPDFRADRYSYAASFAGSESVACQVLGDHCDQLERFRAVSLREPGGVERFRTGLGCPVRQDVDPVLLLTQRDWSLLTPKRPLKKPYLFMYLVGPELHIRKFAQAYAQAHCLELVDNKTSLRFLGHCGPEGFLSWIRYADCVITNSFHGTAFSIIFHKNSYFELGKGEHRNHRAGCLLDAMGVSGREITGSEPPVADEPIDWESVDERLTELREDSMSFLRTLVAVDDMGGGFR